MQVGLYNNLKVKSKNGDQFILADKHGEEAILPTELIKKRLSIGEEINVFVMPFNGKLIASMVKPKILLGGFANLQLAEKSALKSRMDIGLGDYTMELPLGEQLRTMDEGETYLAHFAYDEEVDRYFLTCLIEDFTDEAPEEEFKAGDKVKIMPYKFTNLGIKVIVDDQYDGLLYNNEVFQDLDYGQSLTGYIKKLRPDNKLDVSLTPFGYKKVLDVTDQILEKLKANDGILHLGDKSEPEIISHQLGMSKKTFKKAIGALYKKGLIIIEPKEIRLK